MKDIEEEITKLKDKNWLPDDDDTIIQIKNSIKECIKKSATKNYKGTPSKRDIFNAFKIGDKGEIIKPEKVRILIIGQDPYPEPGKAQGLAFSHKDGYKGIDKSLLNIFKAIKIYKENMKNEENKKYINFNDVKKTDVEWPANLKDWASKNSVLLLNTALTYEQEKLFTQHKNAWKPFFDTIINRVAENDKLVVFLWGVPAQQAFYNSIKNNEKFEKDFPEQFKDFLELFKNGEKLVNQKKPIDIGNIKIFLTGHPSPLGVYRGFRDNSPDHFKECDDFLYKNEKKKKPWLNFPQNNNIEIKMSK